MNRSLEVLHERYPRLVPKDFPWECGAGWLSILDRYFETVDALLPRNASFSLFQVKEKFGSLRIYTKTEGVDPITGYAMTNAEILAQARSEVMCETCGKPGRLRRTPEHWYWTACDEHACQDGVFYPPVTEEPARFVYSPFGTEGYVRYSAEADDFVPCDPPTKEGN